MAVFAQPVDCLNGSSVASPICQEGQSERNFPIFAFSSRFFLFFPNFSWFFPDFSWFSPRFFPDFHDFWQFFPCQGWHSAPLPPQWLRHCSMDSFQQTKYNDICNAISFPDETTKMIQVILPEFASKRQKGDIFTFGDCDPTAERAMIVLSSMNPDKLDKAPIHNLPAERRVRFFNYELSGRGSKQLAAASSAQVKAKSAGLPENRPSGSFRDYSRISKTKMPDRPIISSWNTKEEELKKQAMENKENANVAVDWWRNKDHSWAPWAEHKSVGLPFGRANLMFIIQILKLFRLWPTYFLNLITNCRQKSLIHLNFTMYCTFLW